MKKTIAGITDLFLGIAITIFLALLFLLTQKSYTLLCKSNEAVIRTGNIISGYEKVSADFKNAIIYISTYRNSPSQAYVSTYGKGLWEIRMDLFNLKKLVSKTEQAKLNEIADSIYIEEEWLSNPGTDDPLLDTEREQHIHSIITIQGFLDAKIAMLSRQSINNVKKANQSLVWLHFWIVTLIISNSLIISLTLFLIRKQLNRVKQQNKMLVDIAWLQSHKVRSQIAVLLGLGQLFDKDNAGDEENIKVIDYMVTTAHKLDDIVKEINDKACG